MPYPTITPARERAAAAVYGAVAGLFLAGQDDAAHYVLHQLDEELLQELHRLLDGDIGSDIDQALAQTLRQRFDGDLAVAPATGLRAVEDQAPPQVSQEAVARALRVVLQSTVAQQILRSATLGDLIGDVQAVCGRDRVGPVEVLKRLGNEVLSMAGRVSDPAPYLAKHVRNYDPNTLS